MTTVRDRLTAALREAVQFKSVVERQCVGDNADRLADALLALPGIAIVEPDYVKKRLEYNSHNLGELGKFVRLEYAINILADTGAAEVER